MGWKFGLDAVLVRVARARPRVQNSRQSLALRGVAPCGARGAILALAETCCWHLGAAFATAWEPLEPSMLSQRQAEGGPAWGHEEPFRTRRELLGPRIHFAATWERREIRRKSEGICQPSWLACGTFARYCSYTESVEIDGQYSTWNRMSS